MLDISFGELAMVGAAAYFLLGPAQVKAGAFVAGRGLGRAIGFVGRSRNALESVVANPQLKGVNSELSQSFQEFATLRRELQSATLNPIENVKTAIIGSSVGGTYALSDNSPVASAPPPAPAPAFNSTSAFTGSAFGASNLKGAEALPVTGSRVQGFKNVGVAPMASVDGGADIFLVAMQERALLVEYERMSRAASEPEEEHTDKT